MNVQKENKITTSEKNCSEYGNFDVFDVTFQEDL